MADENKNVTYNHDIAAVITRLDRFIKELYSSVSADVAEVNSFDMTRANQYLSVLRKFVAWSVAQPQLDLPETHPKQIMVPASEQVPDLENESIVDIVRLLSIAREELINSASSRKAAGFITFDLVRFLAVISKAEKFLSDFVATALPMDYPESAPRAAMTPAGRTGV